jgi:hypothetical protein
VRCPGCGGEVERLTLHSATWVDSNGEVRWEEWVECPICGEKEEVGR